VSTCPPLLVAAPPTEAFKGGLFSVARFPELPSDGNGNRWECGIQYEAETCAKPYGWTEVCPPAAPRDKEPTLEFPLVEGIPFTVLLGVTCPLVGYRLEEFERRVRNAFELCEQRTVEEIFWSGSVEDPVEDPANPGARIPLGNNSLSSTDPLNPSDCAVPEGVTVDSPLTITGGVAAIEDYMGSNYCGTPVIHSGRAVAAYAAAQNLVVGAVGRQTTPLGSRWAFGGGYAVNTGPDGTPAPDGVAWLYGTGQVNIWRSEIWINPDDLRYAFNTRTNDVLVFAERKYVITTECACIAVPVSVSCNC
jgi:hypothetical protein